MNNLSENKNLLTYQDVIMLITENGHKKNHLLLGNGFNNSLGIKTRYKDIFTKMASKIHQYKNKEIRKIAAECDYNVEKLIQEIKNQLEKGNLKDLAVPFVEQKIRSDFLNSTHEIISDHVDIAYNQNQEDIRNLMQSFNNYYTLNFDLLVYWLLVRLHKQYDIFDVSPEDENETNNPKVKEILEELRPIYDSGDVVTTTIKLNEGDAPLNSLNKTVFTHEVGKAYELKKWDKKDIKSAFDILSKTKVKTRKKRKVNKQGEVEQLQLGDGFNVSGVHFLNEAQDEIERETYFSLNRKQNLFFLHGALHIYKDGIFIRKIMRDKDTTESLHEKLGKFLEKNSDKTTCVFTDDNKIEQIRKNVYLKYALKCLSEKQGVLVIIGCGFNDNDEHIFRAIDDNEGITEVYISCRESERNELQERVKRHFKFTKYTLFRLQEGERPFKAD